MHSRAEKLQKYLKLQKQIEEIGAELHRPSKHAWTQSLLVANPLPDAWHSKLELKVTLSKTTNIVKNEEFLNKIWLLRCDHPSSQVLSQALHNMVDKTAC